MRSHHLWRLLLYIGIIGIASACGNSSGEKDLKPHLSSPSGNISVKFLLTPNGSAAYQVFFQDQVVMDTSLLGFEFQDQPALGGGLVLRGLAKDSVNQQWKIPWGEQATVINHYNELLVQLQEKTTPKRLVNLTFRAFNDGIGFRYNFPEQENMKEAIILEEATEFNITADHECWWIPGDWDSYEHLYNHTPVSEINALSKMEAGLNTSTIVENSVHTPFTMKTGNGVYLSIHEANLTDYAGMTLLADTVNLSFKSALVNSERLGYAVKRAVPFQTPWRTIQIADKAGDLIASRLILNLNEPNKIGDVSWVKPMKYIGIWWEMHLNKSGWDMEGGRHGATTENAKRYIDFAAENDISGVLVEGWNTGWDRWTGIPDREDVFDFVTPYADYDLKEVVRYAKQKGVELIMHHETSAAPRTYEKQLDTAYQLMQKLDLHTAKLGYVGKIIPDGEHHHGQWMVNHYRKVVETAAKYQIAVNIHEPIKPTGLRRTYPNLVSSEGVRGQEFNAWSSDGGNPPGHLTILPFTRMLAGPIDYTPGIFNIKLDPYKKNNQVNTTLAHQLAAYVIIYSPVQMAADLPEHYEGHPAFQFIRDVGVDWQETKVLGAEIGDHVSVARKERGTGNWFVGTITDENPREVTIDLSFLEDGQNYMATIYKDSKDAHWQHNPTAFIIEELAVNNSTALNLQLAGGGGAAISIMAGQEN